MRPDSDALSSPPLLPTGARRILAQVVGTCFSLSLPSPRSWRNVGIHGQRSLVLHPGGAHRAHMEESGTAGRCRGAGPRWFGEIGLEQLRATHAGLVANRRQRDRERSATFLLT